MTIFVNSDTRVIVQGMTGAEGRKHTQRMLSAGTTIVGGTNPRKAGTTVTFDVQGYGPGADKFCGTYMNTEIARRIKSLIK